LRKVSPTEQEAGNVVPIFEGFVEVAPEKSTFFDCVRKSNRVCAHVALKAALKAVAISAQAVRNP
jgi:hypothetical protein